VHAFLEGTTCRDFVRELRRSPPVDSNKLFDIVTSFASGEVAVAAIFHGKKGKRVDDGPRRAASPRSPSKSTSGARRARSPAEKPVRRDAATTGTRPSQLTRPERALEWPLEAPVCSMTC
jgi:hypothetical protein